MMSVKLHFLLKKVCSKLLHILETKYPTWNFKLNIYVIFINRNRHQTRQQVPVSHQHCQHPSREGQFPACMKA